MRYIVDTDGRVVDQRLAATEQDEVKTGFFAIVDKVANVLLTTIQEPDSKKESDV